MTAAAARALSHPQMAFVRCWAEGLDLAEAWNRYLWIDGHADARRARGELARLLERLRAVARAHGRPEVAALLRRDPEAIADDGPKIPSLDEFRDQQPADFYSEAELIEMYRAEYGTVDARSAARRRQRLRGRLVLAVQWLEQLEARDPAPTDAVTAWFDEAVAARLVAAGILDLEQLRQRIGRHGARWHRAVSRVGPEGAARIERWLRAHEATLGPLPWPAPGGAAAAAPSAPPRTAIVPLERFASPAELDGREGTNRAPPDRCKLSATNDHEAIQAWLRLRPSDSHTWRAYRKEAERFLLWAVLERRRALSSLTGDDCVAYRDFLVAPGQRWCGPRHAPRWSDDWRPFEGALSARSAATAVTILRSLCEWLTRRHYLDSNPWDDVPQRTDAPTMPTLRALSAGQWRLVQDWLGEVDAAAPSPAMRRLRWLLELAYTTGMRLAELARARVEWLRYEPLDDGRWVWSIMVLGKRAKWREVPLPDSTVESFREYLALRGLACDVFANPPETPLLARLDGRQPLSTARIYEVLTQAFDDCAGWASAHDPRAAARIRQATTHWLRHTYGSHAAAAGVPQEVLQANLGHSSPATTSIYLRAEKSRKHEAVAAAFDKPRRLSER